MTAPTPAAPTTAPTPGGGLARNSLVGFTGAVAAAALGFVLTVVVSRVLGASGAGLFFSVVAVFLIISNTVELGADTASVWALPRWRALGRGAELRVVVRAALTPVVLVSAVSALGLFLAAPLLADVLVDTEQQDAATDMLRLVAPFLLVAAPTTVALAGTRGLGSVLPFTLVNNLGLPVARPALVLLVGALGLGGGAVVLAWAGPLVLAAVAAGVVLVRQLDRAAREPAWCRLPPRPRREPVREFWRYAGPRGVTAVLEIALVWLDVLLVTALASTREAGIYAAASRFVTTGTLVEGAMRLALGPRLSELLAVDDRRGAERLHATATLVIVGLSWPLYLALASFSAVLLQLFGDGFTDGAAALTLLALAMALAMSAGLSQTVLLMSGRSAWQLANKVGALVVSVVLNLLLVPDHGMEGAAVAWAAAILLDAGAAVLEVRFLVGLRPRLRGVVVVALASTLCFGGGGVVAGALLGQTFLGLAVYLVVAAVVYAGLLLLLRRWLDVGPVLQPLAQRFRGQTPKTKETDDA